MYKSSFIPFHDNVIKNELFDYCMISIYNNKVLFTHFVSLIGKCKLLNDDILGETCLSIVHNRYDNTVEFQLNNYKFCKISVILTTNYMDFLKNNLF